MNIKVLYHSSTGNTRKVADAIAEALRVKAEPIPETPAAEEGIDLLFLGDGIYAGKPSAKTTAFIAQLNPAAVKGVAVFGTYAGQARIGDELRRLLEERGLRVVGDPFTCKGKFVGIVNRSHPDEADLEAARAFARETAAKAEA